MAICISFVLGLAIGLVVGALVVWEHTMGDDNEV